MPLRFFAAPAPTGTRGLHRWVKSALGGWQGEAGELLLTPDAQDGSTTRVAWPQLLTVVLLRNLPGRSPRPGFAATLQLWALGELPWSPTPGPGELPWSLAPHKVLSPPCVPGDGAGLQEPRDPPPPPTGPPGSPAPRAASYPMAGAGQSGERRGQPGWWRGRGGGSLCPTCLTPHPLPPTPRRTAR